jgi:PIN domain nuclease of toxin-antitoxin system
MLGDPDRINSTARKVIENPANAVFVSSVSGVEIEIKRTLGKIKAPDHLEQQIEIRGLQELPFRFIHSQWLSKLPDIHHDPFDRMLISQALSERMTLITRDRKIMQYSVRTIQA